MTTLLAALPLATALAAGGLPRFDALARSHCLECHDDAVAKGGLDLGALPFPPCDPEGLALWARVYDRLRAGEMPPRSRPRPPRGLRAAALAELSSALAAYERAADGGEGRAAARRLNVYEIENALRDLFSAPWLQIRAQLPEDGEAHRSNKVGSALDVSHVLVARLARAAEYAMKQVISSELDRPPTTAIRYYAREQRSMASFPPKLFTPAVEKKTFPLLDLEPEPLVRMRKAPATVGGADPERREREAVGLVIGNFSPGASHQWDGFRAPVAGRYRVRFSGYTVRVGPGPPGREHLPDFDAISRGRRGEPIAVYTRNGVGNRRAGAFDLAPEPAVHDIGEVWLLANEQLALDPARLYRRRGSGDARNPLMESDGAPAVAFRWMEVEGPLPDGPVAPGYRVLFGDRPVRRVAPDDDLDAARPAPDRKDRIQRGATPREALEGVTFEVATAAPERDAEILIRTFLGRAYRRPATEEEIARYVRLARDQMRVGLTFTEAMLAAYTAVLLSPGFLQVDGRPGPLDDYALATRLALFLWSAPPDAALRARADRGELGRPEVLRAESERLLRDARSRRFVEAFLDFWLDLRKMEATAPSSTLYNDYDWDDALREAALAETQLFFADLVARDLPARNLVHSRHTFVNERLAAHYRIPDVAGVAMRRVALPAGSPRGGLLGQAAILKVTANGTTTSPVHRGKWVAERLLGVTVAAPPAVPAVEPDIRGATTIREQLAQHRADRSCAACHARIDPYGFALESFDVLGGWRDRYRVIAEGEPRIPGRGKDGVAFAFSHGAPVDPSGELPDGRRFADVHGLKRLLLADEARVARTLTEQLVLHATGAPVRFADRPVIERILARARVRGYGVRTLIHEIVQSDLFRRR